MCLFCFKSIGGPGQPQWPHQQQEKMHQLQQWGHKFTLHNLSPSPPSTCPQSPQQPQKQQFQDDLLFGTTTTNALVGRKRKLPPANDDDDDGQQQQDEPAMTLTGEVPTAACKSLDIRSVIDDMEKQRRQQQQQQQQQKHLELAKCLAAAVATAKLAQQKAAEAEVAAATLHMELEQHCQQQQEQRREQQIVVPDELLSAMKRDRTATVVSLKALRTTTAHSEVTCLDNEEQEVRNKLQQRKKKESQSDELGSSSTGESGIECVICGAPASGVHYLVWSCNGCKTFFRRAIMENRKYSCKKSGDCPIDVHSRCSCRHCRFKKCLRMGMKFTEINIDRKRRIRGANAIDLEEIEVEHDPVVRELMVKEAQFRVLLSSCHVPLHCNLAKALDAKYCAFEDFAMEEHEKAKVRENDSQLNFYDWRVRILSIIVDWIKSFPTFQDLPKCDQEAMVIHSAFSLLVFSEAFHTPERYTDRLVYPDGLQVTRNFSRGIYIERNGLNRAMVAIINDILTPIHRIQLTEVEYSFLQALILFDPDCLALSDQTAEIVTQKREQLLESLGNHLQEHANGNRAESAARMAQLLLRIPRIHKVAAFKRQFFHENAKAISQNEQDHLAIEIAKRYPIVSFF